jgi:hypothetical protein
MTLENDMILAAHPVGAASAAMVFTGIPIANEFAPTHDGRKRYDPSSTIGRSGFSRDAVVA